MPRNKINNTYNVELLEGPIFKRFFVEQINKSLWNIKKKKMCVGEMTFVQNHFLLLIMLLMSINHAK